MKKLLTLLIFVIVFFSMNYNAYAQIDSIKVEYTQEIIDSSDYSVKSRYNYLNINLKEEKNILKLGFKPFTIINGTSYHFATSIIFEKKIYPEWSLISEFELSFYNAKKELIDYKTRGKSYKLNFGARYYYGMKKSIQKGNSANNINSNYFELSVMNIPPISKQSQYQSYYIGIPSTNDSLVMEKTSSWTRSKYKTALQLSWGIQRRLNNYTFLDTKVHVGCKLFPVYELNFNELWYVGLDFTIGFGHNIKLK